MPIACGPDYKGCRFEYESPQLELKDAGTGTSVIVRNNAGRAEIVDAAGNPLPVNGVDLRAHGHRHSRGGEDPIDFATIMALLLKSVSPSIGTGDAYGGAAVIEPDAGYSRIVPFAVKIVTSGIDTGAGETVTVKVEIEYEDGTRKSVEKSFTSDGEAVLDENDMQTLWVNGNRVYRVNVYAKTNLSSTSASVSVTVRGIQH